ALAGGDDGVKDPVAGDRPGQVHQDALRAVLDGVDGVRRVGDVLNGQLALVVPIPDLAVTLDHGVEEPEAVLLNDQDTGDGGQGRGVVPDDHGGRVDVGDQRRHDRADGGPGGELDRLE